MDQKQLEKFWDRQKRAPRKRAPRKSTSKKKTPKKSSKKKTPKKSKKSTSKSYKKKTPKKRTPKKSTLRQHSPSTSVPISPLISPPLSSPNTLHMDVSMGVSPSSSPRAPVVDWGAQNFGIAESHRKIDERNITMRKKRTTVSDQPRFPLSRKALLIKNLYDLKKKNRRFMDKRLQFQPIPSKT